MTSMQAEDGSKIFLKRNEIHSVFRNGEAASSNKKEAEKLKIEYSGLIEAEGFIQLQVLNGDEIEYSDLIEEEGFIQLQVLMRRNRIQ